MSNTRLDSDGVKAKFGVVPEQIVDFLALVGDSSTTCPGTHQRPEDRRQMARRIRHPGLLIANAAEIGGKVGENLRGGLPTLAVARTGDDQDR